LVFDNTLAGDDTVWHNDPARVPVAVHNRQQLAFGSGRYFTFLRQDESSVVRFGDSDSISADNKKTFDRGRIAIPVMNAHKLPPEFERVTQYLNQLGETVKLKEFLGEGTDGTVWSTNRKTAVKAHKYERGYYNERDTYLRLAEFDVEELEGFSVP
jgi:hypothetical protein